MDTLKNINQSRRLSIHKEKRSDQEGTIDIVRKVHTNRRERLREEFLDMYRNADKRDKIFIEPDGKGGWIIKHKSREYISNQ